MKKILSNQKGVTLIETLAATVIIVLLLGTLLGALVFGQKVIVGNDTKNREAAAAQEMIDALMEDLSLESFDSDKYKDKWKDMGNAFKDTEKDEHPRQYYILPVNQSGTEVVEGVASAYRIYVRVYNDKNDDFVELSAFVKKGGVGE